MRACALLLLLVPCAWSKGPVEEARSHMSAGRFEEAIDAFERGLKADPGSTEILLDLGWAYQHAGKLDDARSTYSTLMKLDPGNPLYLRLGANVELASRDYAQSAGLARRALALSPHDREAALVLARAQARQDRLSEAVRTLEKAVSPKDIDVQYGRKLARLYEPSIPSETSRALAVVRKLQASLKFRAVPQISIHEARMLGELGRHEQALRTLSRAQKRLGFAQRAEGVAAADDPWIEARLLEAALWSRAGQAGRALNIYRSLEEVGVKRPEKADSALKQRGPGLGSEWQTFSDNYSNTNSRAVLNAGAPIAASELRGWVAASRYNEEDSGLPAIRGQEGGLQWRMAGLKAEGTIELSRAVFTGGAEGSSSDHMLGLSYLVMPSLRARVADSSRRVDTARAVRANRRYRSDSLGFDWSPAINWSGTLNLDFSRFNDGNSSQELRLQVMRRFANRCSLGYAFRHGDSERAEPQYWTPRRLEQHMGLFAAEQPFGRTVGSSPAGMATLQYGAGYGVQEQQGRLVQSARFLIDWRLSSYWSLAFDAQYSRTPGYTSRRLNGGVSLSY